MGGPVSRRPPELPLPSRERRQSRARFNGQCNQKDGVQGEERPREPSLDVGHGAVRPAPALLRQPPFARVRRRREMPLELVDQRELHAVQIPVRPDDPGPEPGDRDAQDRNGHCPPALEALG